MTTPTFSIGSKAQLSKTVSERDIDLVAEVTGDTNPVHMDEAFAQKTRFQGRIAHGILSVGLISAVLGTKLPGPGGIYLNQSVRFTRPVRIGDTITAEVEVRDWDPEKSILTLFTRCFNQDGKDVVKGEATLLVETVE
ncbi:MAG: MaoC family dehydratase [Chloroflexota bacterium]|nr:MaoC family dehydratase [Anaerolineales bacterium]MCB8966487.1 MaoC family dehydratase [Ardenticatenaceae bacterium]